MSRVTVTAHFARRLDEIRTWLAANEASPQAFEQLLDALLGRAIPTLEQFPRAGRDMLMRQPGSLEGRVRAEMLRQRLGNADLRDHVLDNYLLLYAVRYSSDTDEILLLSIRHHRQLSFDLPDLWLIDP